MPAMTRSMMTSRSNSANTPSIWTSIRPTGVEVSNGSVADRNATSASARSSRSPTRSPHHQPAGWYQIVAGEGLDAVRFRRLASAGSATLRGGAVMRACAQLRAALDLWRGPAYAEFTNHPALADEADRLEELWLNANEDWAEAELTLGRHGAPIAALSELVRAHPYRESLRGPLMRALYGAGRQAEALQLFRSTRALLAEELGVEPGPQLQRCMSRCCAATPGSCRRGRDDVHLTRAWPARLRPPDQRIYGGNTGPP